MVLSKQRAKWANVLKEANEISGSRGEANFVWKCKSCKVGAIVLWMEVSMIA
jgi:hypothetical protein